MDFDLKGNIDQQIKKLLSKLLEVKKNLLEKVFFVNFFWNFWLPNENIDKIFKEFEDFKNTITRSLLRFYYFNFSFTDEKLWINEKSFKKVF